MAEEQTACNALHRAPTRGSTDPADVLPQCYQPPDPFFPPTVFAKAHSSGHKVFMGLQKKKGLPSKCQQHQPGLCCALGDDLEADLFTPIAQKKITWKVQQNTSFSYKKKKKNYNRVCWRKGANRGLKGVQLLCPGWQTQFWCETLNKVLKGGEENSSSMQRRGNVAWEKSSLRVSAVGMMSSPHIVLLTKPQSRIRLSFFPPKSSPCLSCVIWN